MTKIVPFSPKRQRLPTLPLPLPPDPAREAAAHAAGIDLSGKAKCWFFIGRGRTGKSSLARYVAETSAAAGGEAAIAAVDPINRSLRSFLDGVLEPPSSDPAEIKIWLRQLIEFLMENRHSGLIDLGGGDTSLLALLRDMPDLTDIMSGAGVEPVAIYMAGTDQHDLTPMAMASKAGFNPRASAIVLNELHGRRETDFDQVMDHPAYQEAVSRGALQLWMPLLTPEAARVIDTNHWRYLDAKAKLGPFYASAVHSWLRRLGAEMECVESWFPGK
jgi:hypothetical protein